MARHGCGDRYRKADPYGRASARRTLDLDIGAVALHGAIHHRKSKAGAALALGREERLQTSAARFLIHPDAGVDDLEPSDLRTSACEPSACATLVRNVSGPPLGMASTALNIRLVSASRISLSAPMIAAGPAPARSASR